MSLRARLVILCALFLALAAAASGVGSALVLRANDARRSHTEMATANQLAQDLEATYVGEAASIRAYFISGDKASLDDYNARRVHADDVVGRLLGLVMHRPGLLRDLDAVRAAGRIWRNESIRPLITMQETPGQTQSVIDAYRDGNAVQAYQVIAQRLSTLRAHTSTALHTSAARADRTRSDVVRFSVGALVAAGIVILVLSVLARLWITRPLSQIARALESEPSDLPFHRKGPTEIVRLSRSVESLRERAHHEIDLAARTREGLSQNAALLMSIRAQLETSPDNLPPAWSAAAQLVPATGIVAGDCYNVDVLGRDYLTVVVVDVAGHGAGSAVIALRANELLRAGVRSYEDPSDAVEWASAQLSDLDPEMFVTAFVGRLHFTSGVLRYVNAGHPPAIVCDGVNHAELAPTGPLIGPFAGKWQSREAVIGPGQMLVAYTDGLIEMRDAQRVEYGTERLLKSLRRSYDQPCDEIVKRCLADVDAYSDGRAHDDVTLTVIRRRLDIR